MNNYTALITHCEKEIEILKDMIKAYPKYRRDLERVITGSEITKEKLKEEGE